MLVPSSEMFPGLSDGTCNISNAEVQEDVLVKEEGFIAISEESAVRIKQEEIPEDITFPDIKSEPDKVSYLCVCVCVLFNTFFCVHKFNFFCNVSVYGQLKQLNFWE
jgi:hypothetical protein